MEAVVEKKFGYLESLLGNYIVSSDIRLTRIEKNMSTFKEQLQADTEQFKKNVQADTRTLKIEMTGFKNEMKDFKGEMKDFKGEMKDFKDEMKEFKDEANRFQLRAEKDRQSMNKKWGDLANKMGTIVEDIVAPSIAEIARKYFCIEELDSFSIRAMRRSLDRSQRREFDVIAEGENCFIVVETKATPRTEYIQDFIKLVPTLDKWFPELKEKKLIPIFASLYIPENSITFLTRNNIFALAMKGDTMDILNYQSTNFHK